MIAFFAIVGFKFIDTMEKAFMAFNAAEYMTERKTAVSYTHLDVYKRQT